MLYRYRSPASLEKDCEVDTMDLGPIVSLGDRMAYLRHLYLFLELRKIIECSLINGESVIASTVQVTFPTKCESGTSKGVHFERHRILFEG